MVQTSASASVDGVIVAEATALSMAPGATVDQ
jgi:hypothetical protein